MFRLVSLLFLFALVPWIAVADSEEVEEAGQQESHVLVLDNSNFTQAIEDHPFIVVEFYAPWCGHCKRLAPEYEKAAALLKEHEPPIILAKVDANEEANKGLAGEYNVRGFPTLKIIEKKGTVVREYKGPRHADGIVSYLKKQSGPPSEEITSAEQGEKLVEEVDILIVGVFSSYDSEEFTNFTSVANELRSDYTFGHTSDASFLPEKSGDLTPPAIRLFKKFDEGFDDLKEFSIEEVKNFVEDASIPLVVTFNNDPVQRGFLTKIFSGPSASKVFLFINSTADSAEEQNNFAKLAQSYKGKGVRFLIADAEDGKNAMQFFGVNQEKFPTILFQGMNEKKYILEEAKPADIASWVKDCIDGKVPEFIKSERIPEKNDEPVKVVVADSFEDMVVKSGKNVLVEFYAPWCGHCKKLAPILEEVAISFQADPDVLIAKFDATANDITSKDFEVKGFPTLFLHSAAGKVIPYEGDRSKEDIIEFITKNKGSTDKNESLEEPVTDPGVVKDEL